jgi:hypothetical protein
MSKFSVILVLMFSYPLILFMMRIQELRELSFQPYASRLSDFFFMRLSVASVVFVSGASKR